ncbi:hypothetical protein [Nocardioides sp. LHG3406-4]|uniref:hypothetical protein n=1 Tax=Nocardioides sp. LHG3406-4 TaxID=2804575 RepID=UPI003CE9BD41
MPKRPQPAPDFVVGHAAGLWNANPDAWRRLVRSVIDQDVAGVPVSVLVLTETTQLTPWKPGDWNIFHDGPKGDTGRDECAITWDTAVWEAVDKGWAEPLTARTFRLDDGRPRPRVHGIIQPLRHRALGRVVPVIGLHPPSGTDGGNALKTNDRARIAVDVLVGRRRLKKRLRKQYPGCQIVETADENVNQFKAWARQLLEKAGGVAVWTAKRLPGRGTHRGGRLIDGMRFTRGLRLIKARVLDRVKPFDHNPIAAAFRFRRRRKS